MSRLVPMVVDVLETMERGADVSSQEELVRMLDEIRTAREELQTTFYAIEKVLVAKRLAQHPRGGIPALNVAGLHGPAEFHRKVSRTQWRKKELIPVVVSRLIDEPGVVWDADGERLPVAESAQRFTERLGDCIGWGQPKAPGLRAIGLEPDEWCNEEFGAVQVQLPARVDP